MNLAGKICATYIHSRDEYLMHEARGTLTIWIYTYIMRIGVLLRRAAEHVVVESHVSKHKVGALVVDG